MCVGIHREYQKTLLNKIKEVLINGEKTNRTATKNREPSI